MRPRPEKLKVEGSTFPASPLTLRFESLEIRIVPVGGITGAHCRLFKHHIQGCQQLSSQDSLCLLDDRLFPAPVDRIEAGGREGGRHPMQTLMNHGGPAILRNREHILAQADPTPSVL